MGIRGFGNSRNEAFEQAAVAMTAVITDPQTVDATKEIEISCEAPDDELLLVDWLNALVYEMATRKMLFSRFKVDGTGKRLHAQVWGETVNSDKHQPAVEVKGATYTTLHVGPHTDGTWVAQCVVDV